MSVDWQEAAKLPVAMKELKWEQLLADWASKHYVSKESTTTTISNSKSSSTSGATVTMSYLDVCGEHRLNPKDDNDEQFQVFMALGLKKGKKMSKKDCDRLTHAGFCSSAHYTYLKELMSKGWENKHLEDDSFKVHTDLKNMAEQEQVNTRKRWLSQTTSTTLKSLTEHPDEKKKKKTKSPAKKVKADNAEQPKTDAESIAESA